MEKETLNAYKEKLEIEKARLEKGLSSDAVQDPDNPADWQTKGDDMNERSADPNKMADNLEEEFATDAVVSELEAQLVLVNNALGRIEAGTFGVCTKCGADIETARLDANTSAMTCTGCMAQ